MSSSVVAKNLSVPPPHELYQFKPLPGSSHSWALSHLKGQATGRRILDIGAGSGAIGRELRPEGPSQLIAVEIDSRSHETLAPIYDRVVTDVAAVGNQQFDWIILLDVLEHMANPQAFMTALRPLLAPGGRIIASVPNIAHWSVRIPLFFWGGFEYQPRGIMDRTHLHFFTRKTFHRMFNDLPACRIAEASSSIEPFEFLLPTWASANPVFRGLIPVRLWLATTLPGLMAYQHLVVVQENSPQA